MTKINNKPDDPVFIKYMLGLKESGERGKYSEALYEMIREHKADTLLPVKLDDKLEAIQDLIDHFKDPEIEDYEKCAYLNGILTKLKAMKDGQASRDRTTMKIVK